MFRYTIQEVVAIVSFIPVIAAMGQRRPSVLYAHHSWVGHRDGELTDVWKIFFREGRSLS